MTRTKCIAFLAAAAAVLAVAPAQATTGRPATASAAKPTIQVRQSRLGKILVDSQGRTLYLFKKDSGNRSACSGACATFWPPVRTSGKPTVGKGLRASKVGTIHRSDGKRQVTYNGHPLYRFTQDHKPGDTNGEGVNAFGARWYVLSPAGRQIVHVGGSSY